MFKDVIKLLILLALTGILCIGIYYAGKSIDNQSKYQHPITQPGARW